MHDRLWSIQEEIEANEDVDRFLVLDRELHLLTYSGCEIPQLITMVTRFGIPLSITVGHMPG